MIIWLHYVEGDGLLHALGSLTAPPQCREYLLTSNLLDRAALACHQVFTNLGSQLLWNTLLPIILSSQNGADVSTVVLVSLKYVPPESQQPLCLCYLGGQASLPEGK